MMTQDEIIEMAQECGLIGIRPHLDGIYSEALVAFAKRVAAKEREAILKYANSDEFNRSKGENSPYAFELTKWIEERGNT
jgi:hypothetical protein